MDDEPFRWILLLGVLVVMPIGMYHRLKAHAQGDKIDRRVEGWFILLTLRPTAVASIVGLVVYLIDPRLMAWSALELPGAVRWIGVGMGVSGAALLIATLRALGTNLTDTVVTRARHTLVTNGPYRWVRHPFYVAAALAVVANTLVSSNWFIGATGITSVLLMMVRSKNEERHLVKRFGAAYVEYMARTNAFVPRLLARNQSTDPDRSQSQRGA